MTQKKKRLTQRQRDERARIKRKPRADGLLPPDKPRLNRKQFAAEVWAEFAGMDAFTASLYLHKAVGCMVGPDMKQVTPEEVGVLKLMKIAVETKKFMDRLKEEDRERYTVREYIDAVVLPIIKL